MADKKQSYQDLKAELEQVIDNLQHEDTDIDEALVLHKKGQELVKKLEQYLKEATKKAEI